MWGYTSGLSKQHIRQAIKQRQTLKHNKSYAKTDNWVSASRFFESLIEDTPLFKVSMASCHANE